MFISFEGGEGSGKTTQIKLLIDTLKKNNFNFFNTREPGGTQGGENIRKLLVNGNPNRWDTETEALLMFAARRDNYIRNILPSLKKEHLIISDRYTDSTRVYQGLVGGLGLRKINLLSKTFLNNFEPNLTFLIDIDVDDGLGRVSLRDNSEHRFESKGKDFHLLVRKQYLYLSKIYKDRIILIDGSLSIDEINLQILNIINHKFNFSL